MFVMIDNPEFTEEAKGNLPGDGGAEFSFDARFVALSATEQKGFDMLTEEGTEAFLRRVFIGMDGVLDKNEQPVPFTDATRDWLIDRPHTRAALTRAYFKGYYGSALGN